MILLVFLVAVSFLLLCFGLYSFLQNNYEVSVYCTAFCLYGAFLAQGCIEDEKVKLKSSQELEKVVKIIKEEVSCIKRSK